MSGIQLQVEGAVWAAGDMNGGEKDHVCPVKEHLVGSGWDE